MRCISRYPWASSHRLICRLRSSERFPLPQELPARPPVVPRHLVVSSQEKRHEHDPLHAVVG
jgi:hypothetical protein